MKGNTYWEFYVENARECMRRIIHYREQRHHADQDIPPQCIMWLRRTRPDFPTLEELAADIRRQQEIKILAEHADEKWRQGSLLQNPGLTPQQQQQLQSITGGLHENDLRNKQHDEALKKQQLGGGSGGSGEAAGDDQAWAQAQANAGVKREGDAIGQAVFKPRR